MTDDATRATAATPDQERSAEALTTSAPHACYQQNPGRGPLTPTAAISREELHDLIWTEVLGAFREAKRAHGDGDFPPGPSVAKRAAGALTARLIRDGLVSTDAR